MTVLADRGEITDTNGVPLAVTVEARNVTADHFAGAAVVMFQPAEEAETDREARSDGPLQERREGGSHRLGLALRLRRGELPRVQLRHGALPCGRQPLAVGALGEVRGEFGLLLRRQFAVEVGDEVFAGWVVHKRIPVCGRGCQAAGAMAAVRAGESFKAGCSRRVS